MECLRFRFGALLRVYFTRRNFREITTAQPRGQKHTQAARGRENNNYVATRRLLASGTKAIRCTENFVCRFSGAIEIRDALSTGEIREECKTLVKRSRNAPRRYLGLLAARQHPRNRVNLDVITRDGVVHFLGRNLVA